MKIGMVNIAKWPASKHIEPVAIPAGDDRVLLKGRPSRVPCRVLAEDEYQLLRAGFLAAGGVVVQRATVTEVAEQ